MKGTIGQEAIAVACERLAPLLKSEGFRKRGSTFWRTQEGHSYQFALHGAWFDTKDRASIDIPIGLVWDDAEKMANGSAPKMPRPYWKCTGYSGLRSGRPSRQIGWRVDRKTDLADVAADVEVVVREHVLPWFEFGTALVKVLQSDRHHTLEKRAFFLKLLLHSGYTSDGFGANSLLRNGCSESLLRKLSDAAREAGFRIRRAQPEKGKRLVEEGNRNG